MSVYAAEISRADLRSIPVEVLRDYALAAAERSSTRAVAESVGIGRTTLHNFLREGTKPHPRIRRLVALWYIAETDRGQVNTDACEMLLSAIPPIRRAVAVEELIGFVRDLHRKHRTEAR